jgi:hypothetical protein
MSCTKCSLEAYLFVPCVLLQELVLLQLKQNCMVLDKLFYLLCPTQNCTILFFSTRNEKNYLIFSLRCYTVPHGNCKAIIANLEGHGFAVIYVCSNP